MVFEEHVAYYLERYLGNYVKGLSKEALKISVWQGDVELKNMQLKPEALNALKLPIKVKAGFLGSVKLKVPWSRLGQEPVVVLLDSIFLLAEPATTVDGGNDDSAIQEAKKNHVKEIETKLVHTKGDGLKKEEMNNSSWIGSLISTIIGNLKLSITNVHIRYEDPESNSGHPFAVGLTLEKLAAVTVDDNGKETFVTGGSLDKIEKSGELHRLSFYFNPDQRPWHLDKKWEDLAPGDWSKIFGPGIKTASKAGEDFGGKSEHQYLLQPVDGNARYRKLSNRDSRTAETPSQTAAITLDDVTLSLSEGQYRDALKMVENFTSFNKRVQYAHVRPKVGIKDNRRAWWQYAFKAVSEQHKKASGSVSWSRIVHLCNLRKKYISLYANCLHSNPSKMSVNDNKEIQDLDRELDADVIIEWRMLSHAYVDKSRLQDQQRKQESSGWWQSWWGGQGQIDDDAKSFTDEEWGQLNHLIGYEELKTSKLLSGQEPPSMLHMLVEVRMRHNATKLVGENGEELLKLSGGELQCACRLYPKAMKFGFTLQSYQVSCPEGLLAESATHSEAVSATFIYMPLEENLDWSLAARASPCYVTVLMTSINRVVAFFQSSKVVSRSVALETATAVQMTLDEVSRNAQQQLNQALKDRPRFSIDLDIAAPKITIPTNFFPDGVQQSRLLLDLGYLHLKSELDDEKISKSADEALYMRFQILMRDVSAFLVDGDYDWQNQVSNNAKHSVQENSQLVLPVLERCGMQVSLQQICVPHPLYPSTRVSMRVPLLGFHISPARYHRLMQVLKVFNSSPEDTDLARFHPWEPSDFEGHISVLVWKGMGRREAVWQHRYAVLAGPFLYLLESPSSDSSLYSGSLIGKQVYLVPPEYVRNVENVVAVCDSGQFNNKVAESANALLLRFEDESSLKSWQSRLTGAIYRSSTSGVIGGMIATSKDDGDEETAAMGLSAVDRESLFLTGALDELKIVILNGKMDDYTSAQLLLLPESPLLEFRAIGTKVEFLLRTYGISVGAVLQTLEIEDKYSGHISPSCRYLARSYIRNPQTTGMRRGSKGRASQKKELKHKHMRNKTGGKERKSENDRFFDAVEDLVDSDENSGEFGSEHVSRSSSGFYDAVDGESIEDGLHHGTPSFQRIPGLLVRSTGNRTDEVVGKDKNFEHFVKAQVIFCTQESPDYANIDKQVVVTLATLSFFCNRKTILAMLDFASAITTDLGLHESDPNDSDVKASDVDESSLDEDGLGDASHAAFARNDSVVKGLLGRGKERLVFLVALDMDRALIVLNTDDGNQLSLLSQEDIHTEVKVFPASFGLQVTLGNLRMSDGSLDDEHPYRWICDMRDADGRSFVELQFLSFNREDEDYSGYEYSIIGKLSEVRIVFLNRFVQEMSTYFLGLVPPNSASYVVKLKNRVTDVENFFTKSEIEGQPALKLGISLTKPVILMPRSTHSTDFLELDILQINVSNTFQWIGGLEDELGAVRMDTTSLQLQQLHLVIGVNGKVGGGIIKEAKGLSLVVRRPLRDIWHQLPAVEASIQIEELVAALSDKEYQVITECALENLAETPNLSPTIIKKTPIEDSKEGVDSELLPSEADRNDILQGTNPSEAVWTTIKVSVSINMMELGLFSGQTREDPLASLRVTGVWASYKSNTSQESSIMATLENFSVRDDREGTEPELQYMIGNAEDSEPSGLERNSEDGQHTWDSCRKKEAKSAVTMLVMDAKLSQSLQMISLRIQRPRLLVALDFLLAVAEFFIPNMHAMLSDGKSGQASPWEMQDGIFLEESVYKQSSKEITFSPKKPLVADKEDIDSYLYDGRGGTIRLLNHDGKGLRSCSNKVIIFVGDGKNLRFKNVVFQNGDYLDSCIYLGNNSSYSAAEDDGVFLEGDSEKSFGPGSSKESIVEEPVETDDQNEVGSKPAVELMFDFQAIAPELTFYDSVKRTAETVLLPERLLRARMNIFSRFVLRGEDMELNAEVNGLNVEASSGVNVVEPVDITVKYTKVSEQQNIHLAMTEVFTNFSFSILQLMLRLQVDVMSFLRITSEQFIVECVEFDKIWVNDGDTFKGNQITFWRPRAPPGFAVLGDCLTPRDDIPSKGVIALNMSLARVKRPISFVRAWSSNEGSLDECETHVAKKTAGIKSDSESEDEESATQCVVWLPVPPQGYVAFGCVASVGRRPPPLNTSLCVSSALVTSSSMKDCLFLRDSRRVPDSPISFWRVDNSTGTFFPQQSLDPPHSYRPCELRHVVSKYQCFPAEAINPIVTDQSFGQPQNALQQPSTLTPILSSTSMYENAGRFKLIWWDKGSGARRGVSIWRPVIHSGCAILGDLAVEGYEPPSVALVLRDTQDGSLSSPLRFQKRGEISKKKGMEGVSFWYPVAPPGYFALGCTASRRSLPEPDDIIRCVRKDLVIGANYMPESVWDTSRVKYNLEDLSIWQVDNEAGTFFVRRGLKHPPKRLALRLAEGKKHSCPDNLIVGAEVKRISVTLFDDFGGLMAPLLDAALKNISLSLRGRMEAMSSIANFSLAATTFNGNYNAWEPLIELWDGRVRYEYNKDGDSPTESRIRLTGASDLNLNVSTANINMFLEAYSSWNRLRRLEEGSLKQLSSDSSRNKLVSKSAIDIKNSRSLSCINHNELGEELFLRIDERNHKPSIILLPCGGTVCVKLPTARSMQDPNVKLTTRRTPVKYVSLMVGCAEVPRDKGIGGREYMVAIRIIPRTQTSDQRKLQFQSARTRCVTPENNGSSEVVRIQWDEVFIFEVEPEEGNVAEIKVTDLSKGVPIGFFSASLSEDTRKKSNCDEDVTMSSPFNWSLLELQWNVLQSSEALEDKDSTEHCGRLSLAQHFFSISSDPSSQELSTDLEVEDKPGIIQVSTSKDGPWSKVVLNYALGAAPWQIHEDIVASELFVSGGVKHIVIRSLVVVQNNTDFRLEVSLCLESFLGKQGISQEHDVEGTTDPIRETFSEAIFENERYQPLVGWGSTWPGHLLPTDPGRYSRKDFSNSSKEFPHVHLPQGWEWTSDWYVDKVVGVDEDGWGYGFDFWGMKWPPSQNMEKALSFVRRRCWVRSRQSVGNSSFHHFLGAVDPSGSISLPISFLRSTSSNYCLQVRPRIEGSGQRSIYEWSQVVRQGGGLESGRKLPINQFKVQSLVESEALLSCPIISCCSSTSGKDMWFYMEATSKIIGKNLLLEPIKDWKLVVTAPLVLSSYLPVSAEFSVSEKSTGKGLIVRERGVINPGGLAKVFVADLRKPCYLTFLPQGGWHPNKEATLISHPFREPANHISFYNSRSSRKLQVQINYALEEKGVALKMIQLYVPCWLDSETCPALRYRIFDIAQKGEKLIKSMDTEFVNGKVESAPDEPIEQETESYPTMLSNFDPKTMGLSLALTSTEGEDFGPVSPLTPLTDPDGNVEIRGPADNGAYFRFLVTNASCPLEFSQTKVVQIRPYMFFTNRAGQNIFLKQPQADDHKVLQRFDWRVCFPFLEAEDPELLQIRLGDFEWSYPFAIEREATLHILLRNESGRRKVIRVDIRGYEEGSRFLLSFRLGSARGPYRLENRTKDTAIKYRQVGLDDRAWQKLGPHSTNTFAWEDIHGVKLLEVMDADSSLTESMQYEIDKIGDQNWVIPNTLSSICVQVTELLKIKTVRFFDKILESDEEVANNTEIHTEPLNPGVLTRMDTEESTTQASASRFELVLDISKLGISVVDQKPQEILFSSLEGIIISYSVGYGEGISRLKLLVGYLQVDNQLPLAWMPVLLAPEMKDKTTEFVLKGSITMYDSNVEATQIYPHMGLRVGTSWRVNVHEPIIWAIVEMLNNLHMDRLSEGSDVVQVDPEIRIDLFDVSEIKLKLTLETASATRPRGMLGIWSPVVTTIGNTNKMPIRLNSVSHENRYMRKSAIVNAIVSRIRRDLIHQPLQILSGVDVLGMASSTLGTLSKGAAELSNDGKFMRRRSRMDRSRNVAGVTDGLMQGTEALARGVALGFSGVVTKPITNAHEHGVIGFFQGVGKAALGFVMLPVSGLLDFVSLAVNGVGVSCTNCLEMFEREREVYRARLPRSIQGDGILCAYDEKDAQGQAIMQLAQSGAHLGRIDLFKEPAKFAWSDYYQKHFDLPRNRILMITNQRVMLLVRPRSHSKNPVKSFSDPSSIFWEVPWDNLLAVELASTDVVLHLRKSPKNFAQIVVCYKGDPDEGISHANRVVTAIEDMWQRFGPKRGTLGSLVSRRHHRRLLLSGRKSKHSSNHESARSEGSRDMVPKSDGVSLSPRQRIGVNTHEDVLFDKIWSSEHESSVSCSSCLKKGSSTSEQLCTIWRPVTPEGYVSVGDIAHVGIHPPTVATTHKKELGYFAPPVGYDLVWRNWKDGFTNPISIWSPRPPEGYVGVGCVGVPAHMVPETDAIWCVRVDITEVATFEAAIWQAPAISPWQCYLYPVASDSLTFLALREQKSDTTRQPRRIKPQGQ